MSVLLTNEEKIAVARASLATAAASVPDDVLLVLWSKLDWDNVGQSSFNRALARFIESGKVY